MIRSAKPNKCKHCKVRMPEEKARHVLHDKCIDPWLAAERARKERKEAAKWRAAARVERMLDKVKREKLKSIPDLIDEAQTAFNLFIRLRDAEKPCICCNKPLSSGDIGGRFDCGHYRSRGGAPHLRFNEDNAHGQRKYCNRHGAGRAVDYRIGLIAPHWPGSRRGTGVQQRSPQMDPGRADCHQSRVHGKGQRAESEAVMKPHIKQLGGLWYCAGDGVLTFAFKPWDAYLEWLSALRHAALEQINQILGGGL